ncbi:MAG: FHA domain-containing protein, partial [Nitrospirae bacterium]|nr:FHA domain-containing protein [Fimbriimonadaceae bacterium]
PAPTVAPVAAPGGPPRLVRPDGVEFALSPDGNTIGRDFACTIAWADQSSVSRRHAEIALENGAWIVKDLGSTNGTFVNGAKAAGPTRLNPGDTLILGQVTARFEA